MKKKVMDKLAWENAQALAAGMSYGKWKAKQAPVQIVKKMPEGFVKCPYCGEQFKRRGTKIYCNDDCRQRAYYQRKNTEEQNEHATVNPGDIVL